ncbi:hypothetical protein [Halalkalibacter krulwichiae]|uniref:DUF3168 domain-containing protein n=1 Tax=Halalkalibacter krulwichiae TaxID=199441 RepID=A0A1X9MKE8_9BACI|nr:hypothetical protein [Halalkalibacter krulwichiae]ARK32131.1 hypothetical protein BkAM31D_21055 [Halalkalibacter krulwichiae]
MSMNALIISTLQPTGVPVSFANYNNTADAYIVFVEYNQAAWLTADDKEMSSKHFYQVDVFSSSNYLELVKEVKRLMKEAGFGRMFESETYDEDMKKFRKILRFSYITKIEEE